jgi:hypothetical protein
VFLRSLFSEKRSESTNLLSQGGSNVLRSVRGQVPNTREDPSEDDVPVDELSEACGRESESP